MTPEEEASKKSHPANPANTSQQWTRFPPVDKRAQLHRARMNEDLQTARSMVTAILANDYALLAGVMANVQDPMAVSMHLGKAVAGFFIAGNVANKDMDAMTEWRAAISRGLLGDR